MYRQGVVAILSAAGHIVESPADPLAWVRQKRSPIVLLTLQTEQDWDLLGRLCFTATSSSVIALVEALSASLGVRAMRAGARSVLTRAVPGDMLRRTVEAVIEGHCVMPSTVAAALATGVSVAAQPPITAEELSWLRQLAGGTTVARLAEHAGYSERAMFRLLRSIYRSMGVSGRMEAVMRAQEQGWLQAQGEPS